MGRSTETSQLGGSQVSHDLSMEQEERMEVEVERQDTSSKLEVEVGRKTIARAETLRSDGYSFYEAQWGHRDVGFYGRAQSIWVEYEAC